MRKIPWYNLDRRWRSLFCGFCLILMSSFLSADQDPKKAGRTDVIPGQPPEAIDNPAMIGGDPVLKGFQFDFRDLL